MATTIIVVFILADLIASRYRVVLATAAANVPVTSAEITECPLHPLCRYLRRHPRCDDGTDQPQRYGPESRGGGLQDVCSYDMHVLPSKSRSPTLCYQKPVLCSLGDRRLLVSALAECDEPGGKGLYSIQSTRADWQLSVANRCLWFYSSLVGAVASHGNTISIVNRITVSPFYWLNC